MSDSICLVGRTNVGKSLLFNRLIQYKNSIVLNKHGVTRDINEGKVLFEDKYLYIYDTAGQINLPIFGYLIVEPYCMSTSWSRTGLGPRSPMSRIFL